MRKMTKLIAVFFAFSLFTGIAMAAQHDYSDNANPRKGKYLWKKNCRSCHSDGAEGGELSPSSKTQSQWNNIFKEGQSEVIMQKCNKISKGDLHDIQHYMHGHAQDSDQPESCG